MALSCFVRVSHSSILESVSRVWFIPRATSRKSTGKPTLRVHSSNKVSQIIHTINLKQVQQQKVVIVGAGIAGLATALALHRLGIKALVLEEADSLRKGGTSLTLFKNGWRVLDALGISPTLRQQYKEIEGLQIQTDKGRVLREFMFRAYDKSQEVRGVERRALLESLAQELPTDTISFGTTVKTYERIKNGEIKLLLSDGSNVHTKVLLGCDGVRSSVAKWLGFQEPQYVGYSAYRGLGVYPSGHPFQQRVCYIYGKGIRVGYVPLTSTKVYWFLCFNSLSPGRTITEPSILKGEALQLVQKWPKELLEIIENTPDEVIIKTALVDRWLWPFVTPKAFSGCVSLAGDAWHPMTPNLAQGACCALEDSIVIAKKLTKAFNEGKEVDDLKISGLVTQALKQYTSERWPRVFPLTIKAYAVGALLQWENDLFSYLRDNVLVPKIVQLKSLLEHTDYDCGMLYGP